MFWLVSSWLELDCKSDVIFRNILNKGILINLFIFKVDFVVLNLVVSWVQTSRRQTLAGLLLLVLPGSHYSDFIAPRTLGSTTWWQKLLMKLVLAWQTSELRIPHVCQFVRSLKFPKHDTQASCLDPKKYLGGVEGKNNFVIVLVVIIERFQR